MKNSRRWIILSLSLVCIALLIPGALAAYTNVESIKRVVSTKSMGEDIRFSSNYLSLCDRSEENYPRKMISAGTQGELQIPISICNYPQNDITRTSDEAIRYTFEVRLVDLEGQAINKDTVIFYQDAGGIQRSLTGAELAAMCLVNGQALSTETCSMNLIGNVLPGGTASTHSYRIGCAAGNVPCFREVMIQLKAIPEGAEGLLSTKMLAGMLRFLSVTSQSNQWTGSFLDTGRATTELDAFNYELSGTAEGIMKLIWKPQYVEPGIWSLEDMGLTESDVVKDAEAGVHYVEFQVGGVGNPTQYRLQFYRTNGIPEGENWDAVRQYVSFTFGEN